MRTLDLFMEELEELCKKHKIRLITHEPHPRQVYIHAQDVAEGLGGEIQGLGNVYPADYMDNQLESGEQP